MGHIRQGSHGLRCWDDGGGGGDGVDGDVDVDVDGEKFKTIMRALWFLLSNSICHSHGNDSCTVKATQSSTPNTYTIQSNTTTNISRPNSSQYYQKPSLM